jgi:acyl carrier protein
MPARPRGLLEPCAATSGKHGSEGASAQQCAGATRPNLTAIPSRDWYRFSVSTRAPTWGYAHTSEIMEEPSVSNATETEKSADEIRRALRDLIILQLVPLEEDELSDDAQLVDDVLDSLGIAELAIFIEDEIGRPLDESEETRSTFATINSIVEFIVKNR